MIFKRTIWRKKLQFVGIRWNLSRKIFMAWCWGKNMFLILIFVIFHVQNLGSCTRNFFPKKSKKMDLFENHKSMTTFLKKSIFLKNTRVTLIFDHQKLKIHVPRPIIFIKNHQKWALFCADGSEKGIEKIWIFEGQIIIFTLNYEKKVHFFNFFSKKERLFSFFL